MYIRPAILAAIIPLAVTATTLYSILQRNDIYLWPIIGISVRY
ncbi:unnamed protein product [Thelazia callipaeda]|uniref:ABC transporter permease n=1 Tax=Thelazia callipaeda TaxID=103827 RepID=A0A0N5CWD1_THECL|nr:unnamed protein product [Thelazia callipaeda]